MNILDKNGKELAVRMTATREDLHYLDVVKANRPPGVGYCAGALLQQFEGTQIFQWYANTSGGTWTPYGPYFFNLDNENNNV